MRKPLGVVTVNAAVIVSQPLTLESSTATISNNVHSESWTIQLQTGPAHREAPATFNYAQQPARLYCFEQ